MILPLTDEAGAMHIAEGIRQEIAALQVSYEGWSIPLTASLGLCTIAERAVQTGRCGGPPPMPHCIGPSTMAVIRCKRASQAIRRWQRQSLFQ